MQGCKVEHSKWLHDVFQAARSDVDTTQARSESADSQPVKATSLVCRSEHTSSKVVLPVLTVFVRGAGREYGIKTHALLDPGSNEFLLNGPR